MSYQQAYDHQHDQARYWTAIAVKYARMFRDTDRRGCKALAKLAAQYARESLKELDLMLVLQ